MSYSDYKTESGLCWWFKTDGSEILLNERPETIAFARSRGWVRKISGRRDPPKIRIDTLSDEEMRELEAED